MLGIGKWQCTVDTMFYRGEITIEISDEGGEYGFKFYADGKPMTGFEIHEVHTENGDTIVGTGTTAMMPGKEITATMKFFDDDRFEASLKIPFLGQIKAKDGHKIG